MYGVYILYCFRTYKFIPRVNLHCNDSIEPNFKFIFLVSTRYCIKVDSETVGEMEDDKNVISFFWGLFVRLTSHSNWRKPLSTNFRIYGSKILNCSETLKRVYLYLLEIFSWSFLYEIVTSYNLKLGACKLTKSMFHNWSLLKRVLWSSMKRTFNYKLAKDLKARENENWVKIDRK